MKFLNFHDPKPMCRLYKYYSNVDYVVDVISNDRIHFESPSTYNDIYDCSIAMNYKTLSHAINTVENMCSIMKKYLPEKYYSLIDELKQSCEKKDLSVIDVIEYIAKKDACSSVDDLLGYYIEKNGLIVYPDNYRITCFSERKDSLLMWSYYADNHKGFCLGFDIASDSELGKHCHKVLYSDHFFPSSISAETAFFKSAQWSHEQEWRIVKQVGISNDKDLTDEYAKTNSLVEIVFGTRTSGESINKVLQCLNKKEKTVTCYRTFPSIEKYGLRFKEY